MKVNMNIDLLFVKGYYYTIESDSEQERVPRTNTAIPSVAQALLPSTICASFVDIVKLLDDHAINSDGIAVYQIAYQVDFLNSYQIGGQKTFSNDCL